MDNENNSIEIRYN